MIYMPADSLKLHRDNIDALIEQLRAPGLEDSRAFELLDFIMPIRDDLTPAQQARLKEQMLAMKWDYKYILHRPHTFKDSPGAYADWILYSGYWVTRYARERQIEKVRGW